MKTTRETAAVGISLVFAIASAVCFVPRTVWGAHREGELPQAIITYGYLALNYPELFTPPVTGPTANFISDVTAIGRAVSSLGCDVGIRMAFPHRAFVIPLSLVGQWIGYTSEADTPPIEDSLFVTESFRQSENRVLVVASSVAPERTTVFWIESTGGSYATKLVYDSFKKGQIGNAAHTVIGSVTSTSFLHTHVILLREWAEPGSRPGRMGSVGRVFQVDMARNEVTLKSSGALPPTHTR